MTMISTTRTMTNPEFAPGVCAGSSPHVDLSAPLSHADCLLPQWSVAPAVCALVTTRDGGVSAPPYGRLRKGVPERGGLNLGLHTGDDPQHIADNRARLQRLTRATPAWLTQVHGCDVVLAEEAVRVVQSGVAALRADASVTAEPGIACVVMVADCLPVLFADATGRAVGAAHAGWRGLLEGVLERTATRVAQLAGAAPDVHAFLGPAIGPLAFEVGPEVRAAFLSAAAYAERDATEAAFVPRADRPGKYLANLVGLARLRLARVGVTAPSGGEWCTVTLADQFYSYRRENQTGRFAGLIWIKTNA